MEISTSQQDDGYGAGAPSHNSNINKYDKGHVLIIGGEMAGASRLVAYSSRKTGCGLSTISVEEKNLKF